MVIVCSTDDMYVQHCGTMLTSLFENNKEEQIFVYVLTSGLSMRNSNSLKAIVDKYNGEYCCLTINDKLLEKCPIRETDHLTIVTYYRLLIPQILPLNITKVLYLDCDIIINSSLKELWEIDISDWALGAVEEHGCSLNDAYERLEYESKYGYFNAGVLLINVDYWRKNKVVERIADFIAVNSSKLKAHDQDVLNALFHDKYLHLDCKWNVEEAFFHNSTIVKNNYSEELLNAIKNPVILHYTWKPKPWEAGCEHPLKNMYYIYLEQTEWKNYTISEKKPLNLLKSIYKIMVRFGLKTPIYYKL